MIKDRLIGDNCSEALLRVSLRVASHPFSLFLSSTFSPVLHREPPFQPAAASRSVCVCVRINV